LRWLTGIFLLLFVIGGTFRPLSAVDFASEGERTAEFQEAGAIASNEIFHHTARAHRRVFPNPGLPIAFTLLASRNNAPLNTFFPPPSHDLQLRLIAFPRSSGVQPAHA
jgi:hypothetical protein